MIYKDINDTTPMITPSSPSVDTGYGVPGTDYSKAVASSSSVSYRETRRRNLNNGYYVWEGENMSTGQWEDLGGPIPWEAASSGEAITDHYNNPVTTPNGTVVSFGNIDDPVKREAAQPVTVGPSTVIGMGTMNGTQVAVIDKGAPMVFDSNIGKTADSDKTRYIPAVTQRGFVTSQGYWDVADKHFHAMTTGYGYDQLAGMYGSEAARSLLGVSKPSGTTGTMSMVNVNWEAGKKPTTDSRGYVTGVDGVSGLKAFDIANGPWSVGPVVSGVKSNGSATVRAGLTVSPVAAKSTQDFLGKAWDWYWNESGLSPASPSYKPVELGSPEWLLRVAPGQGLVGIKGTTLGAGLIGNVVAKTPALKYTVDAVGGRVGPIFKGLGKAWDSSIVGRVGSVSPGETTTNLIDNMAYPYAEGYYSKLSMKAPEEYLKGTSEVAFEYPKGMENPEHNIVDSFYRPSTEMKIPAAKDIPPAADLFDEGGYQYLGKNAVNEYTVTADFPKPKTTVDIKNPLDYYDAHIVPNPEAVEIRPADITMSSLSPELQGTQGQWRQNIADNIFSDAVKPAKTGADINREIPSLSGRAESLDDYYAYLAKNPKPEEGGVDIINQAGVRDLTPEETTMKISVLDEKGRVNMFESRGTVTPKINDELGFYDAPRREYFGVKVQGHQVGGFKSSSKYDEVWRWKDNKWTSYTKKINYDAVNVGQVKLGKTLDVGADNANLLLYSTEKTDLGKSQFKANMGRYNSKNFSSGLNFEELAKNIIEGSHADVTARASMGPFTTKYTSTKLSSGLAAANIASKFTGKTSGEMNFDNIVADNTVTGSKQKQKKNTAFDVMLVATNSLSTGARSSLPDAKTKDKTDRFQFTVPFISLDTGSDLDPGIIEDTDTRQRTWTGVATRTGTDLKTTPITIPDTIPDPFPDKPPRHTFKYILPAIPNLGGGRGSGYGGRAWGRAYTRLISNPFAINTSTAKKKSKGKGKKGGRRK
jgi:hypothetical protein